MKISKVDWSISAFEIKANSLQHFLFKLYMNTVGIYAYKMSRICERTCLKETAFTELEI